MIPLFEMQRRRLTVEEEQKWREVIPRIPFLRFPADWEIQIIPPFLDATVRFMVRLPNGEIRSVFLDTRNSLGYWEGHYWEVYPYRGDIGRCSLNETEKLLEMIGDLKTEDEA